VAREGVDLVFTRAPRTADQDEVERVRMMIEPVRVAGGAVLFVQLACDRVELLTRVQNDARRRRASSPTLRFWSTVRPGRDPAVRAASADRYDLRATSGGRCADGETLRIALLEPN